MLEQHGFHQKQDTNKPQLPAPSPEAHSLPEELNTAMMERTAPPEVKTALDQSLNPIENRVTRMLGIKYPLFCGAMYPSSNPELVLAVARSGGMGVIQPVSFEKVHGWDFREALRYLKQNTDAPFGVNIIVRDIEKRYTERMKNYVQIALEEGCRFFVTSLGDPNWVVEAGKNFEAVKVFHKVTNVRHAKKAVGTGVDGLILVNNEAGGHLGDKSPEVLFQEFQQAFAADDLPLILAGGVGDEKQFCRALGIGYDGVLMGTRFIATEECSASKENKEYLVSAAVSDLVLTRRVDGVPLSVINTPFVEKVGLDEPFYLQAARILVRYVPAFRPILKFAQALNIKFGMDQLARGATTGESSKDYFQAGKSVSGITKIEPVRDIVDRFVRYYHEHS